MSFSLLGARRFAPLFIRQFLSAFNDNFVKNALVLLILYRIGQAQGAALVSLAGAIFITPFFLLSALGGELADKYDKTMIARRLSLAEIAIAGIAAAGFALSSIETLFFAMFLFGVTAALFGPVKYGILPDHLTREELPAGNALVEGATFLAILGGTITGGFVLHERGVTLFAGGVICFAILACIAAWQIPATRRGAPDLRIDPNIFASTLRLLRLLRNEPPLWRLAGVTSLFWLFGSIAISLLPQIVTERLHGADSLLTIHLAIFAVAIALGSGLAAFLLDGRIVLLPTVFGAAIIGFATGDLALAFWLNAPPSDPGLLPPAAYFDQATAIRAAIDLGLAALAGGLMIVPAFAAIQVQSPIAERARIIAAVNVHNAAFMALGGVMVAGFQSAGAPLATLLATLSALRARRRGLDPERGCRAAHSRRALDPVSRLLSAGSHRLREYREGGTQSDCRRQSRQLPRRRSDSGCFAARPDFRHRSESVGKLVGPPIPAFRAGRAPRSDETAGRADARQRGPRGSAARDLSRGPSDRHRQPDEGL